MEGDFQSVDERWRDHQDRNTSQALESSRAVDFALLMWMSRDPRQKRNEHHGFIRERALLLVMYITDFLAPFVRKRRGPPLSPHSEIMRLRAIIEVKVRGCMPLSQPWMMGGVVEQRGSRVGDSEGFRRN